MATQFQPVEILLTALAPTREVRTASYSDALFKTYIGERPTAITLAPRGMFDVVELIDQFSALEALIQDRRPENHTDDRLAVLSIEPNAAFSTMHETMQNILREPAWLMRSVQGRSFVALVPDFPATIEHEKKFQAIFRHLLRRPKMARAANPAVMTSEREIPKHERDQLLKIRRAMLKQAGTLSSDDLAAAAASTTTNASQYAADQRSAGAIFGVKFGKEWRYPAFQFDTKRQVRPEIKPVLAALTPDAQGWDRLQWFLSPHETLKGKKPLDVWKKSPNKVIEAATTERWDGRD